MTTDNKHDSQSRRIIQLIIYRRRLGSLLLVVSISISARYLIGFKTHNVRMSGA